MRLPRAYILAGGESSRFGTNKARALINGEPMILHVAKRLESECSECVAVGHALGEYEDLGLRTICDIYPGNGPLSGLHAALCDAPADSSILLVACDMIGLQPAWITSLLNGAARKSNAIAFRHEFWEPMPALYSTAIRDTVKAHLASRTLSLQRLLKDVNATALPVPSDWHTSPRANTPEELARYVSELRTGEVRRSDVNG